MSGERRHDGERERSPHGDRPPPHPVPEQHRGGHADGRHEGEHAADVGAPDGHPVDEDGEPEHDERRRDAGATAGEPLHQQAAEQERGPGELAVGEVPHPGEPSSDRRRVAEDGVELQGRAQQHVDGQEPEHHGQAHEQRVDVAAPPDHEGQQARDPPATPITNPQYASGALPWKAISPAR